MTDVGNGRLNRGASGRGRGGGGLGGESIATVLSVLAVPNRVSSIGV